MMLRTAVAVVLAAAGLAACSSTQTPAAKPAAAQVATVSTQTTCDLLFTDDQPRLWTQAVDLIKQAEQGKAWDGGTVHDVAKQLDDAAASSRPNLRPHIEAMAAAISTESGESLDAGAFKVAAREIANVCAPYVAG